ncbi:MAG: CHASE domain-containing protein, partial [Sulfuricaulis sp.]|nr:CHASE domain-containing protein [Sulfuricaulis sp.]
MQPKTASIAGHPTSAVVVLAVGFILSVAASYWALDQIARDAKARFEIAVADAEDGIERRIQAYTDVFHGVRGLFSASESVSRDVFRRYISSLNLEQRHPGIQVVAFIRRVPFERKRDYEAAVRRDTSLDPNGYPNFTIRPPGDRPEYFVVEYLEPMAGNKEAFGLDTGGEPIRLASVEHARDSGQLTATAPIMIERGGTRHVGLVLRLPVYRNGMPQQTVEQRREALIGLISASYRMDQLMRKALSEQLLRQFRIRIHDAGLFDGPAPHRPAAGNLLFDNDSLLETGSALPGRSPANDENASFSKTLILDVGGRRWNVYFTARQASGSPADRWLPLGVLFGGITISLLLFGLIRSLATVGNRAVTLAESITEDLRRSEARLAKSQRQTQELIEALPNPIYFKGTDGRYLGVNLAWEKFFGMPRNTFIGKTVHDLYPENPEVAERLHRDDQALWNHPGSRTYETSITTPDGRRHDAIYYKATFTHTDGSVAGLIGTIVDITERKHAEAVRAQLAAIVENSNDAIVGRSLDRKILSWNSAAERLFGYTAGEAIGQSISLIIPPDREQESVRNRALAAQGIAIHDFETERLAKSGQRIAVSLSQSPITDEHGAVVGVALIFRDIREREQAETALRDSETRYRSVIAAIAEGV